MAREGAQVVILGRTTPDMETTSRMVEEVGGKVLSVQGDISRPKDVEEAVDKAQSHFGKIDILMNNAAVIGPVKPLYEVDEEAWDICMDINVKGSFLFSKAVIPHMIRWKRGKIINVMSGLGVMAMPLFGGYSIAKAGVIHLTRILAEELKPHNIQVNGLDPGVTLIIFPLFRRIIWGMTALEKRKEPFTLMSIQMSQSCSSTSYKGFTGPIMAALFMRTSIFPKWD